MDAIFPGEILVLLLYICNTLLTINIGQIPLGRVDFNARYDYEYVKNYKILQTVFAKNGIDKVTNSCNVL